MKQDKNRLHQLKSKGQRKKYVRAQVKKHELNGKRKLTDNEIQCPLTQCI